MARSPFRRRFQIGLSEQPLHLNLVEEPRAASATIFSLRGMLSISLRESPPAANLDPRSAEMNSNACVASTRIAQARQDLNQIRAIESEDLLLKLLRQCGELGEVAP